MCAHTVASATKSEEQESKTWTLLSWMHSLLYSNITDCEIQLHFNHPSQGNTKNSHCGFQIHVRCRPPVWGSVCCDISVSSRSFKLKCWRMAVFGISTILKIICIRLPLWRNQHGWRTEAWECSHLVSPKAVGWSSVPPAGTGFYALDLFRAAWMLWLFHKPSHGGQDPRHPHSTLGGCGKGIALCSTSPDLFLIWQVGSENTLFLRSSSLKVV